MFPTCAASKLPAPTVTHHYPRTPGTPRTPNGQSTGEHKDDNVAAGNGTAAGPRDTSPSRDSTGALVHPSQPGPAATSDANGQPPPTAESQPAPPRPQASGAQAGAAAQPEEWAAPTLRLGGARVSGTGDGGGDNTGAGGGGGEADTSVGKQRLAARRERLMRKKQQATKKSKGKNKGKNKGRSRKKVAKASAPSAAREPTSPLPTIGEVQSPLTARSTRSRKPSIKPQPAVHRDGSKASDTPAAAPAAGGEATALGALGVDESLLADAQALSAALADTESDADGSDGGEAGLARRLGLHAAVQQDLSGRFMDSTDALALVEDFGLDFAPDVPDSQAGTGVDAAHQTSDGELELELLGRSDSVGSLLRFDAQGQVSVVTPEPPPSPAADAGAPPHAAPATDAGLDSFVVERRRLTEQLRREVAAVTQPRATPAARARGQSLGAGATPSASGQRSRAHHGSRTPAPRSKSSSAGLRLRRRRQRSASYGDEDLPINLAATTLAPRPGVDKGDDRRRHSRRHRRAGARGLHRSNTERQGDKRPGRARRHRRRRGKASRRGREDVQGTEGRRGPRQLVIPRIIEDYFGPQRSPLDTTAAAGARTSRATRGHGSGSASDSSEEFEVLRVVQEPGGDMALHRKFRLSELTAAVTQARMQTLQGSKFVEYGVVVSGYDLDSMLGPAGADGTHVPLHGASHAKPQSYTIWRRYSEFVRLHAHLSSLFTSGALPPLPAAAPLKLNRLDPAFVAERRDDLDVYIARLVEMCGTRVFQGDGVDHEPAYLSNNVCLADFLQALPSQYDVGDNPPFGRSFSRLPMAPADGGDAAHGAGAGTGAGAGGGVGVDGGEGGDGSYHGSDTDSLHSRSTRSRSRRSAASRSRSGASRSADGRSLSVRTRHRACRVGCCPHSPITLLRDAAWCSLTPSSQTRTTRRRSGLIRKK